MNTCGTTPLPAWMPFTLSQSAALSERLRRKGLHEGERKESIPETSPQLSGGGGGVRGQRSATEEVCQVLSGAGKPMYDLLHAYLLNCGQVGTQSSSL